MTLTGGISAAMGLLCLLVAAIMWMVADRWHPRVVVVLVLAGMSGLAGSGLGNWIHRTAVYLDAAAGKFIGQFTGTAITGLVAILALALVVVGLWKDKVTGKTIVAAMFVPVTVAMVPGMVGQASTSAVTALASAVASVGGALFGIR